MTESISESSWSIISNGSSDQVILCFDFPVTGRAESDFAGLTAKLGKASSRYKFLQTALPSLHPDQRPSAEAYTLPWLQAIGQERWQVVAILGYCAGGVYAASVAEGVCELQHLKPKVILFDPQFSDAGLLIAETRKTFNRIAPLLTGDEKEYAEQKTSELAESEPEDIADLAAAIVRVYREVASAVFVRLGLGGTRQNEIFQLFESYMSWLSAGAQIDPCNVWKNSLALISTDYVAITNNDRALNAAKNMVGHRIEVEVTHKDILQSDSAVKVLLEQIGLGRS